MFTPVRGAAVLALLVAWSVPVVSMADNVSSGRILGAPFGKTTNGAAVELYTLRNRRGMEARIATYGSLSATGARTFSSFNGRWRRIRCRRRAARP